MELDGNGRRRLLGGTSLLMAILLLVAGETIFKAQLTGVVGGLYWLVCFIFTLVAIFTAFLDVRALQRRTRAEQKDLVQSTLDKIQAEAKNRRRK